MDYEKLGLKAGLEIHQQLDTGKLFSRTPGLLRRDEADYEVRRKLHAVAGETGEVDMAVAYEAAMSKTFVYQGYHDTISLVELDEAPPRPIDQEALGEVLKIALLLNCEIYPVAQIMRKTVIDGSNTGGFQRTVLIAHDGYFETEHGKVSIESIALEEDSARLISKDKKGEEVVFRLDRLGIPLVEITTGPDMATPEAIKAAALKLGEIIRACKVKRGIGTIRQDVNISTKGHERVEIKGFQDAKTMITTIQKEITRQQEEIPKNNTEGHVRKALPDSTTEYLRPMPGQARMYPETDLPLLKNSRDKINETKKHLPKLREEIVKELEKEGLSSELIRLVLADHETLDEYKTLMSVHATSANLTAKMITLWRTEFSKKNGKTIEEIKNVLTERTFEEVLEKVKDKTIGEGDVKEVLSEILNGKTTEEAVKIERTDDHELEEGIRAIIKTKPGLRPNAYMGMVIAKFGSKVDKRKAMELLNKLTS